MNFTPEQVHAILKQSKEIITATLTDAFLFFIVSVVVWASVKIFLVNYERESKLGKLDANKDN